MLIENPDAFKSWLTSILEPLCDADPAALAKYVYALVKKDKPVEELREVMVDQLDVFLQHETKPFVEMLFTSLESNEYLKHVVENEVSPPGVEEPPKEQPAVVENHVGEAPAATTSVPGPSGPRSGGESRARSPTAGAVAGSIGPPRLVVSRAARHAAPAPLNRHPHNEHTLVKVLPLTELLEEPVDQPPRRRDRRGDSTRDKDDRRRRRSRSWERRARARRHVRDSEHNNDVRRRLPSRSPSPRGRYRNRSPPPPALERQTSRSRSRSPVIRERDLERERDRLRVPREMERDRMSRDREHRDRISSSRDRERSRDRSRDRSTSPHDTDRRLDHNDAYKRRCRDFDEKGYCMRGDLCQWDHGSDPVVLEDAAAALSSVLALPPAVPEYNPLTPDIWCGGAGSFPPYAHPHHPHPPRELIPIPSSVPHRIRHDMSTVGPRPAPPPQPRHPAPHKKTFDYNRFGCARPPLASGSANCSLDVKKVPRGLNDITHLNNHFSKFGKIVNIQVCYEGDPEAALITFSNPTEANIAYKSTEAVLNNRFIKVFWHNPHNPDNKQENMAPGGQHVNKPNDRQNSQHPMSHNKVLINRDNIKATADNKQQQEKEKEAENGVEPKKEAVKPVTKSKLIMDQHKRAQALLETQLQQQMLLIQKLESGNVTEAQRPALLEAISSAQEGIENLRKQLMAYNDTVKQLQQAKKPKTMEEAQKEILDAELDLFNKQQEGQDVTELQNKITELRRQMAVQFPAHIIRRPNARNSRFNTATRFTRGGLVRQPRHSLTNTKMFNHSMNQSVDHRPRALLISGFEVDELEALVAHFSQYGEVVSKEEELSVPQLVLQYKARAHAELAALNGKHYNDRTLSITWVGNTTNNRTAPVAVTEPQPLAPRTAPLETNNKDEPSSTLSEESLLRFDEEEEEEADEERSWRR